MTPKEKAEELFNKYCYAIRTEETDSGYFTNVIYAKQCALIAVDEILNEIDGFDLELTFNYYLEVKKEIENL
jgi:hypothetical protein